MRRTPDELLECRDQALHDLADVARQEADGELDRSTAARLRASYEAEAAVAIDALAALEAEGTAERAPSAAPPRRRRRLAGVAVGVVGITAAGLLFPRYLSDRPAGGFVSGNEVVSGGRDLSTVTNEELEQVVADNPDVIGMRLALARRYFEAGSFGKALDHYQQVLDREPHPEALTNVGWILYQTSDEVQVAAQAVSEGLERDPDSILAAWFLANIRLDGLDDPAGAAELARGLLARDDLAPRDREAVQQLLDRATAQEQSSS